MGRCHARVFAATPKDPVTFSSYAVEDLEAYMGAQRKHIGKARWSVLNRATVETLVGKRSGGR